MIFSSNSKEQPQGYFRIDTIFYGDRPCEGRPILVSYT